MSVCADLKAARVDGEDECATPSFRWPRFGGILWRRLLTEELSGHNLAALTVDGNLKRLGVDAADGIAVPIDDLDVHGDDVDRTAEDGLRRECHGADGGDRRSEQQRW